MSDALPAVPPLPPVLIGASSKAYLGLAELTRWVQVVTAGLGELGGGEGAAAHGACPDPRTPAALLGPLGSTLTAAGTLVRRPGRCRGSTPVHARGEATAALLAELGASMVMIGHPERARDPARDPGRVPRQGAGGGTQRHRADPDRRRTHSLAPTPKRRSGRSWT